MLQMGVCHRQKVEPPKQEVWGDCMRNSHLHPAVVVVNHRGHLRLLKHDLRHPHYREHRGISAEVPTSLLPARAPVTMVLIPRTAAATNPAAPLPIYIPRGSLSDPKLPLRRHQGSKQLFTGTALKPQPSLGYVVPRVRQQNMGYSHPRSSPAYARLSASGSTAA